MSSKITLLGAASLAVLLGGCATTQPLEAAGVTYRMPRTDVTATLSVELQDCGKRTFVTDLTLAAKPGVDLRANRIWRVPGEALASTRVKRGMKISLSEDGVITGVNSETADRSGQVLGNVIKTAATIAPLLAATEKRAATACNADTIAVLTRVGKLKEQIRAARQQLAISTGPAPVDAKELKALDRLVRELAGLRSKYLTAESTAVVKLDPGGTPSADFDGSPFAKWFDGAPDTATLFPITWTASVETTTPTVLTTSSHRQLRPCGLKMWAPAPKSVTLSAVGKPGAATDGLRKSLTVPAAQWGEPAELCLDVGFGENRTIGLTFDKFGRTTEFAWNSDATAENVSGAIAGAAPDLVTLAGAIRGPSAVAAQKQEIDELQTLKTLNELKACRAILEAGGFDCAPKTEGE